MRKPSIPDSGGRQFFVVNAGTSLSMKGQYTVFGEVVSGMEVVDQISTTPVDGDKAKERVEMKVTVQEPRGGAVSSRRLGVTFVPRNPSAPPPAEARGLRPPRSGRPGTTSASSTSRMCDLGLRIRGSFRRARS